MNCGSVVGSSSTRLRNAVSGAGFGWINNIVSRQFCGRSPRGVCYLLTSLRGGETFLLPLHVAMQSRPFLHPLKRSPPFGRSPDATDASSAERCPAQHRCRRFAPLAGCYTELLPRRTLQSLTLNDPEPRKPRIAIGLTSCFGKTRFSRMVLGPARPSASPSRDATRKTNAPV